MTERKERETAARLSHLLACWDASAAYHRKRAREQMAQGQPTTAVISTTQAETIERCAHALRQTLTGRPAGANAHPEGSSGERPSETTPRVVP